MCVCVCVYLDTLDPCLDPQLLHQFPGLCYVISCRHSGPSVIAPLSEKSEHTHTHMCQVYLLQVLKVFSVLVSLTAESQSEVGLRFSTRVLGLMIRTDGSAHKIFTLFLHKHKNTPVWDEWCVFKLSLSPSLSDVNYTARTQVSAV